MLVKATNDFDAFARRNEMSLSWCLPYKYKTSQQKSRLKRNGKL